MGNKNIISMTEARRRFFEIADELQGGSDQYILTERGRPKVVVMSAEMFESWELTVGLIEKYANLQEKIRLSEEDKKIMGYIDLESLLSKEGYLVADNAKKKYGVSSSNKNSSKNV